MTSRGQESTSSALMKNEINNCYSFIFDGAVWRGLSTDPRPPSRARSSMSQTRFQAKNKALYPGSCLSAGLGSCMTTSRCPPSVSRLRTSPSTSTSQVSRCRHLQDLPRRQHTPLSSSFLRHHLLAAAVREEEVLEWAAAPAPELHHLYQPGPVWGGGVCRLLLGLQHHVDQVLEDGRPGG